LGSQSSLLWRYKCFEMLHRVFSEASANICQLKRRNIPGKTTLEHRYQSPILRSLLFSLHSSAGFQHLSSLRSLLVLPHWVFQVVSAGQNFQLNFTHIYHLSHESLMYFSSNPSSLHHLNHFILSILY